MFVVNGWTWSNGRCASPGDGMLDQPPRFARTRRRKGLPQVRVPKPGTVIAVAVADPDLVKEGQTPVPLTEAEPSARGVDSERPARRP